jgi:hypothetical protein
VADDGELCGESDRPFTTTNLLGAQKMTTLLPLATGFKVVGWVELVVVGDCLAVATACCNNADYPDCRNAMVRGAASEHSCWLCTLPYTPYVPAVCCRRSARPQARTANSSV